MGGWGGGGRRGRSLADTPPALTRHPYFVNCEILGAVSRSLQLSVGGPGRARYGDRRVRRARYGRRRARYAGRAREPQWPYSGDTHSVMPTPTLQNGAPGEL